MNTPPKPESNLRFGALRHALMGALSASILFVALRFLLTPVRIKVLTSLLSPTDYGMITLLSMSAHGMAVILSFGGLEYMLRMLPRADEAARLRMLRRVLAVSGLPFCIVAVCILMGWAPASWYGGQEGAASPAAVALLFLLFMHVQQRIYFLLGCRQHVRARVTQLLWSDLWFLPLLALLPWVEWRGDNVIWVWGIWLAVIVALTARWVPFWKRETASDTPVSMGDILRIGLPAMPAILGEWTFRLFGHYLLLAYTNFATMALYALAVNVAMVGYVAGVPLVDKFSADLNSVDQSNAAGAAHAARIVSCCGRYLFAVAMPVALALLFSGDAVLHVLSGEAFWAAGAFLPWLAPMPFLLLMNLFLSRILVSVNRSNHVAVGSLVSAVAAVLLSLALIPNHGAFGAIWGMEAGIALAVIYFVIVSRVWRFLDAAVLGIGRLLLGAAMMVAVFWGLRLCELNALVTLAIAGSACLVIMLALRWVRLPDFIDHHEENAT
jgi:O-antigen/teichoic acid export membrane protein